MSGSHTSLLGGAPGSAPGVPPGTAAGGRVRAADATAMLWAVLCCWTAVWGNYLMLDLKVTIFWIVPVDMFAVPALVTLALLALRRRAPA